MSDTNVGRGMVPHRPTCRCDECRAERTDIELRALRARLDRALRLLRIGLDVGLEPHERAEANALLAECTANNGDERHG